MPHAQTDNTALHRHASVIQFHICHIYTLLHLLDHTDHPDHMQLLCNQIMKLRNLLQLSGSDIPQIRRRWLHRRSASPATCNPM